MISLINEKKIFNFDNIFKFLIVFVPISIIIGNFVLNINVTLIIILFIYFFFKKKISFHKPIIYIFFFICISILINNLITTDHFLSGKATLGIMRFLIFFIALMFFFETDENKKFFFKIIFFLIIFVLVDVLIQYVFGKDIFGNEFVTSHGKRLSGPFGDELVVGAYLSKLFFLGLIFLFYKTNNKYLYIFYLLLSIIVIFLTQERSAFFISLFAFIFFIFFFKIKIRSKVILLSSLIIILSLFIRYDETTSKKYFQQTILQLGFSTMLHNRGDKYHTINTFWDSRYGAHFLTAFQIFNDNKILGSGIKTFRKNCGLKKYENINSQYSERRCNTHPHNIYLEILSEGGLILFIPFCTLIFFLLVKNINNLIHNKNYNNSLINICLLIILFFPIQTTGSFFSTFNGVFYWFCLSIIINNMKLDFFRHSSQNN